MQAQPADPARFAALADVYARTFLDEPLVVWPAGSSELEPLEIARGVWEAAGPIYAERGWVWEVPPALGVAAWVPPGDGAAYLEVDREVRAAIGALTDDGGARYVALWDWLDTQLPEEPHWYLDHVGVAPEHQGRGIGGALIRVGLDAGAHDGVPAFLETARPQNLALYEHLGFRVVHEADAPGGGPHVWFLRADPAG
jgi:ribosomal protein S18 acetylase RimI-like enzyme